MRHGKKFNHLGRQRGHRHSMLANMGCSLIEHKRINTTVAKAKALRMFIEPLITKSKLDTTHNRRTCFAYLRDKHAITELFRTVADKVGDRPGGYTRIIKMGNRLGDNADMAMIELVDFNELYKGGKREAVKSKSRRGGKKKADGDQTAEPKAETKKAAEPKVEEPKAETPKVEEPAAEPSTEETPKADDESTDKTAE